MNARELVMPEVRFKPNDKVRHIPTGDVLTFKEYGTNPWEGWAVVTHSHGTAPYPVETWWRLDECQLDNTEAVLVEQNKAIKALRAVCLKVSEELNVCANIGEYEEGEE